MKIVLLGYMASGKTFIGKKLSKKIPLKHIDLDHYIEIKERLSISELFSQKGEIAFRLLENNYLKELLHSKESFVLSVGGGTPCYANNIDLITTHSQSVYLKASIKTLYNRLIKEKNKRPLVKNISIDKLHEFIAKHLFERQYFYNKADIHIDIDNLSISEISELVLKKTIN